MNPVGMKLVLPLLALLTMAAAPASSNWPCYQRLVPKLTAATLWAGPVPQHDWHANPAVVALVDQVGDRRLPLAEGVAKLKQYVATKPGDEARAELFAGLVDRSNVERTQAINRLFDVSRRLRAITNAITDSTKQLDGLPANAPQAQRDEVVDRRALLIRQYDAISRTVQYACEIPVDFEHRLGEFARVLQPPQN
jgi:hypothetical protein